MIIITKQTELAKNIKKIRQSLGMSMEEFGKIFDTVAHKSLVSKWEKGLSQPNNERLKKIAEIGNTTVNEILYGYNKEYQMVMDSVYKNMLKENEKETHIGKALRFPDTTKRKELLKNGIERTLSVPLYQSKLKKPKDILDSKIHYYIEELFLEYYINNFKSNSNVIAYVRNKTSNIYSEITEYQYNDFNLQLPENNLFKDIGIMFTEKEKGINVNLLRELDSLLEKTFDELDTLKNKYPDQKPQKELEVEAFTIDPLKILAQYSFEIDEPKDNEDRRIAINSNSEKFLNGLLNDNPKLYDSLIDELKNNDNK
ncbi:helix-turn-helix domain-containing protein [Staphylococcus xylosus]|uniref:helix-turn-helix domain-containing protein n=1 Tax=Staphylococcus xylosus TaxID=1288 RepID=UPI003F57BF63